MKGDNIDTFVGANSVPSGLTIPSEHADAQNPGNLHVAVGDHDLSGSKSGVDALSASDIASGSRALHFRHGDQSNGNPSRTNSLTWHHKAKFGHMELIDMNVHGAFWHYGGIAGWSASEHKTTDGDDDGETS
ncbi:HNH endonuclease [Dyella sp.]|uniref:HNH endonuclease n=1 Tax=Dyella sp. TaxID=1869338 RepID=UPI002ED0DF53